MTRNLDRLRRVLDAIDEANARDPNTLMIEGRPIPAELVYGRRMSATLAQFIPDASEPLVIAARGQHIERWTSPRSAYPQDRAGYLRWRTDLKAYHGRRLAEIMAGHGFEQATIDRVGSLVLKERLKHDAETQALEDVICIVFLTHYLADFATKHDRDKLAGILAKTWRKMSPRGQEAAGKLALFDDVLSLLEAGLKRLSSTERSSAASRPALEH